jgi:broad specificity phosphatase PhoE
LTALAHASGYFRRSEVANPFFKELILNAGLPVIYLARHGETAWSLTGQHTGLTDLPLTTRGESDAVKLGTRLHGLSVDLILCSPLKRAAQTCALAGFESAAKLDADLVEWDYGQYEGRTSADIQRESPDWQLFRDGCPGGESLAQIGARVDRVVQQVRQLSGNALLFSSGHFLRIFTARWLGLEPAAGKYLTLSTTSLSVLGYEHALSQPVIQSWNDTSHLK